MSESNAGYTAEQIRSLIEAHSADAPMPELAGVDPRALARTAMGRDLLEWGRRGAEQKGIPDTTYTLYRRFRLAGERPPYERPYFAKRTLLTREVTAAWLGQDDDRIDPICDLIWSVCEETSWVVPAHEGGPQTIDLFAAETGCDLAHIVAVLGERLPDEIRARVREEAKRRIFDRYLEHGRQYSWNGGSNNWTGVCAGSVGQTFLLLEDDLDRQAQALALVIEQLDRFIERGFEEDGGCLEGIGYWNYGLSQCLGCAEMLRARTGGAIDLLEWDKMTDIARYPLAVYLGNDRYASFADAHEHASVKPYIAARLAERTGVAGLIGLIGSPTDWRFVTVLRNLLWWDGRGREPRALQDVFLPVSGIARLVGEADGIPLALAIKAGHNNEPHNQNDVGSFVLSVDGTVYLCDPGPGLYSKDYFGAKRYENVFANSYGHSVPLIGGTQQAHGAKYRGAMEKLGDKSVGVRFEGAYKLPALKETSRHITIEEGAVVLEDTFQFDGDGLEVQETFMTWLPVEVADGVARVLGDRGTLEIHAQEGAFAAERLEEACKANHKSEVLTRLAVTYPPSRERATRFTMVFHAH